MKNHQKIAQKPWQILNKINIKNMIENVYKINSKRANMATQMGFTIIPKTAKIEVQRVIDKYSKKLRKNGPQPQQAKGAENHQET